MLPFPETTELLTVFSLIARIVPSLSTVTPAQKVPDILPDISIPCDIESDALITPTPRTLILHNGTSSIIASL